MNQSERSVWAIYVGDTDVLYHKFNLTESRYTRWGYKKAVGPPVNPPADTNSDYKCVVATGGYYWRVSRCTDEHRVVCQSGKQEFYV